MKRDKQAHIASSVTSQQQNHMLKPATACTNESHHNNILGGVLQK